MNVMINFIRSKYLPYALGLACAVMFYLVYMDTQIKAGTPLFSEAMMGDASILLMMLNIIPLFMERIIYTHEHNDIRGTLNIRWLTVLHIFKLTVGLAALACAVLSFVFMFTLRITSDVNLFFLIGRAGCILASGGLFVLMLCSRFKSEDAVTVAATTASAGAALMFIFIHLQHFIAWVGNIVSTLTETPEAWQVLFFWALAHLTWMLCLFLVDAVIIYITVHCFKRLKNKELPLEYL